MKVFMNSDFLRLPLSVLNMIAKALAAVRKMVEDEDFISLYSYHKGDGNDDAHHGNKILFKDDDVIYSSLMNKE